MVHDTREEADGGCAEYRVNECVVGVQAHMVETALGGGFRGGVWMCCENCWVPYKRFRYSAYVEIKLIIMQFCRFKVCVLYDIFSRL